MKIKKAHWFSYEKVITETDILEIAKKIGETRKKIDEIEEARKTLKKLQEEKLALERQLEQGKITGDFKGIHSYHDPEEGLVTISPDPQITWKPNSFATFTREMTPEEKEKYCQLTMEFEEEEYQEWSIDDDDEPTEEELTEYFPDETITDEAEQTQPEEELRIDVDGGQYPIYLVRRKGDDHNAISYHGELESAKRFIELYPIHKDAEKVIEIIGLEKLSARKSKEEETEQIYPAESTEDQTPEYTIEKCESIKYPWNILEKISGKSTIYERFRTKEEAESFMRDFIEEKKPFESNPNVRYRFERVFGAWKVLDFGGPESFSKTNPRFVQVKCTYHEAKELCEKLNSALEDVDQGLDSTEDQKVISDTENYKIVENPDGSLRTIRKGTESEKYTFYYNESALAWIVRRAGKQKSEFEKSFSTKEEAQEYISRQLESEGVEA